MANFTPEGISPPDSEWRDSVRRGCERNTPVPVESSQFNKRMEENLGSLERMFLIKTMRRFHGNAVEAAKTLRDLPEHPVPEAQEIRDHLLEGFP